MHPRDLRSFTLLILATGQLCVSAASAQSPLRSPASLLVFAEFDSTPGHDTILTVTNTNPDTTLLPSGQMAGTVDVEFVFMNGDVVGGNSCLEFNRTHRLTPNDTISALASFFNPTSQRGYVYVFAKQPGLGETISFNWLTGTSTILSALAGDYTVEPFSFRAIGAQGTLTDVDGDNERDLDLVEYEPCTDELLIPRFHGQASGLTQSHLVLLNLTGAAEFAATFQLLAFDDNENAYSVEHIFQCWMKVALTDISGAFSNGFL